MEKKELRKKILALRDDLKSDEKEIMDDIIFSKLIKEKSFIDAKVVFLFVSYKSEVDTHRIIRYCFENDKVVCIPKVINKKDGMKALRITSFEDLKEGYKGILECDDDLEEISTCNIDLVIMPGAVFDVNYGRIGYGGGFYDKFLGNLEKDIFKIALCYDFQIVDEVPIENHDIKPNKIISDKRRI
ncbi:5-formyltetrahydrofolate cyclo-ligase [Clostridium ihumii]|uniref:5-formyltetrahydrofolate cyclo-ligase n=1 Tax=Clostridium ihumii TaxID=1470356 RepID=UPI003D352ED0